MKLRYKCTNNPKIFITYSKADYAGYVDTGRSTGRYLLMVSGGAVSWYSKLQTIVNLSSTEAEYLAAVEAGNKIFWMRNILEEL
jgi:hypothetical protein